ncbi:MAG: hypothetical protein NE328_17145 [Lentisphaeraceae bacterium]|nr:hypothetical protein [Lentisphaeraceae bacterium]
MMQSLQLKYKEPAPNILELILYPILLPIKFLQALNNLLVSAIWGELMKGEKDHSPFVTAMGLAFFFIGSLYCYKYETILDNFVLIFTILVVADKFIIWLAPFLFERTVKVSLKEQENGIIEWKSSSSKIPRYFTLEQVQNFFVRKHTYERGFLLEEEVETWELILRFKSSEIAPLEIYESADMSLVQQVTVQLSQKFGLHWSQENEVADSGRASQYAAGPLSTNYTPTFSKDIKFWTKKDKIKIKPCLNLKVLLKIFSKAFKEAGFILFLVVLSSFVKRFGKVLAGIYGPTFGVERPEEEIYIVDSIFYFFKAFKPDFDPVDFFELGVAVLFIILYMFNHIKSRSIYIKGNQCRAVCGTKRETFQFDKMTIKVIDPEDSQILIHDDTNAIVLDNFGSLEDARKVKRYLSSKQQASPPY